MERLRGIILRNSSNTNQNPRLQQPKERPQHSIRPCAKQRQDGHVCTAATAVPVRGASQVHDWCLFSRCVLCGAQHSKRHPRSSIDETNRSCLVHSSYNSTLEATSRWEREGPHSGGLLDPTAVASGQRAMPRDLSSVWVGLAVWVENWSSNGQIMHSAVFELGEDWRTMYEIRRLLGCVVQRSGCCD